MNTTFIVTGVSFGRGIKPEEATGRNVEDGRTKAYGKGFFYNALIDEMKRRLEREEQLKIAREKKNKLFRFYNSEHWKRANADMQAEKRSKKDGYEYKYYWSEEFSETVKKRTPPVGCRRQPDMSDELKHVQPWVEV